MKSVSNRVCCCVVVKSPFLRRLDLTGVICYTLDHCILFIILKDLHILFKYLIPLLIFYLNIANYLVFTAWLTKLLGLSLWRSEDCTENITIHCMSWGRVLATLLKWEGKVSLQVSAWAYNCIAILKLLRFAYLLISEWLTFLVLLFLKLLILWLRFLLQKLFFQWGHLSS